MQEQREPRLDAGAMLSDHLHAEVRRMREEKLRTSPQLTLGKLIDLLSKLAADKRVRFDFRIGRNSAVPGEVMSWRGAYAELASSFSYEEREMPTVAQVLADLQFAIGKTFEGYKGGQYMMGETTPVWVASYGDSGVGGYKSQTSVGVIGVKRETYKAATGETYTVVIETQAMEY